MSQFTEELGWFRQLGRAAKKVVRSDSPMEKVCSSDCEERREWRSFDLADVMEMGGAHEVTTGFIKPAIEGRRSERLVVERSDNLSEHILKGQNGEPLLLAVNEPSGDKVNFYVPTGGDPPRAVGPAFTLQAVSKDLLEWSLTSSRCECCAYSPTRRQCCNSDRPVRELARIHHVREDFRNCSMMTMEVELPVVQEDGSVDAWCERAGTSAETEGCICLQSRRPKWSPTLKSLTLDFHGRCSRASVKNFQLDLADSDRKPEDEPELLFGKTDSRHFALDFRHPLSMAQAFAIALSTKGWS